MRGSRLIQTIDRPGRLRLLLRGHDFFVGIRTDLGQTTYLTPIVFLEEWAKTNPKRRLSYTFDRMTSVIRSGSLLLRDEEGNEYEDHRFDYSREQMKKDLGGPDKFHLRSLRVRDAQEV